jgi:MraZ protein
VEIDAAGRINIPKDLASFAAITKDVVLSSAINIVEVWDKQAYEQAINNAANDFADLAEDVMGDTKLPDGIS